jgi:hypothetical protein
MEETSSTEKFWEDPEKIMFLIDLIFLLREDDYNTIPS